MQVIRNPSDGGTPTPPATKAAMTRSPSTSRSRIARTAGLAALAAAVGLSCVAPSAAANAAADAAAAEGYLTTIHRFKTLGSTVPDNGDQNPYAIVVAPVAAGSIAKGDVLVTNFNDHNNLQGLGSTIMRFTPSTGAMATFASIPRHLPQCPGGIGLTTAMTMLTSGWVIVGSLPSEDGTTATKGPGCLLVLDSQGKVVSSIAGPQINGPWGNMAVIDHGGTASVFVSNAGFGVGAPGQDVVDRATVVRLDLSIPAGKPPVVQSETVIASGFGQQADKDVFIIGPTGLALGAAGVLYVSDAIHNRIAAIPDAATRTDSAGTGTTLTTDGLMHRPLAMTVAPNGNLLVVNGLNGQVVEVDPATGKQLHALWVDANRAQSPPGSGDLFGIAMTPSGNGFYYVKDEMNTLVLAE
jgi:hypothetical protein